MLKIGKTVLPSPEQWEIIIEGMRNPMNSWGLSDSYKTRIEDQETKETSDFEFFLGDVDHDLMMRLAKGGSVHAKYRRMITVYLTINAPLYWWKEFDTYKVGTAVNSCSTMHKIHSKKFELQDFSCEHLVNAENYFMALQNLSYTIDTLNTARCHYIQTRDKIFWWQMIQLLPSSYNQKRTVMLNYEVLCNIYHSRKNHKLDEWAEFCKWIETLPYAKGLIYDVGKGV